MWTVSSKTETDSCKELGSNTCIVWARNACIQKVSRAQGFRDLWWVQLINYILVQDMYISKWRFGVEIFSSLTLYREINCIFDRADYLQVLENKKFGNVMAKLFVETGRHWQIPRQDRKCILCNINDEEDEYHFILICPFYNNIRNTHIPRYFRPCLCMFKYVHLLNETSKQVLDKLSSFCLKVFKLRVEHVNV